MIYHFEISLLWILFGALSWFFGGFPFNHQEPTKETLDKLRSVHVKMFLIPPRWVLILLGETKRSVRVVSTISVQMQLGGLILILLGLFAGFLTTIKLLIIGCFFSLLLGAFLPRILMRRWPQA